MSDCIFCKIVSGEIPSYKILEDDKILAFLDISPTSRGHVIVIPERHFKNMEDIDEETLNKVLVAVKRIGRAIKIGLGSAGYNVNMNNDPVAGQVIPHFHFHIIPRAEGDSLKLWPQGEYEEGEAQEIAKKIKNGL